MDHEKEQIPTEEQRQKRQRMETLVDLCWREEWTEAQQRALTHPEEASVSNNQGATPLALACREGAPSTCIQAILEASPQQLRRLLPSRGTPLHEAIVCEKVGSDVIQLLLEIDERLQPTQERATLMQDVDGHTPLHLLIRRRSQTHIIWGGDAQCMPLLELLVKSYPAAVGIPDRGEYEEPPLVMALKASLYAGADYESNDWVYPRVERRIHEMVQTMLRHYPQAASRVLTGARGKYTALHSAVFHGRCSDTIQLLLEAEEKTSDSPRAALLANTQGELPLHFAAMRGEPPRSIALLGDASPMAVLKRDASGLTPMHWLWIRYVSTLLSLDDRGDIGGFQLETPVVRNEMALKYNDFCELERGDFDSDLNLIRKIDPPLDFLRMRHIPPELWDCSVVTSNTCMWAQRSVQVLQAIRARFARRNASTSETEEWTRQEAVACLFWAKMVSLLKAAATTFGGSGEFLLVHTAMSAQACPPPIARMASMLFSEELSIRDSQGRLPLHLAASREWHTWDWRTEEGEAASVQLLRREAINLLRTAIEVSPNEAARVADADGRLVLHHAVDTFVRACSRSCMIPAHESVVVSMLDALKSLLQRYPESLERRDGRSMLYPFLQATSTATECRSPPSPNGYPVPFPEEMPLSIVYLLLRENPALVRLGLGEAST